MEFGRALEKHLNQAFPVPDGESFFRDFPVWDPTRKLDVIYEIETEAGGESGSAALMATAAARVVRIRPLDGSGDRKVGIIGAVATDPRYRNQGLASRAVSRLVARLEEQGIRQQVLWGGEADLYKALGFEPRGVQARVPLRRVVPAEWMVRGCALVDGLKIGSGWTPGLIEAMRGRVGGIVLSESDAEWLSAHQAVEWRWIATADGRVVAYAALGRGIDLPNLVHEWWADDSRLLARVLMEHLGNHPTSELLGHPAHFARFGIWVEPTQLDSPTREALALMRGVTEKEAGQWWFWGLDSA